MANPRPLPGGFPQFKRHLAAIHRMPPTHAGARPFHVSDVVYSMLRAGLGKQLIRRGSSSPSSDAATQIKASKGSGANQKKLTSNTLWSSILRKPY